MYPIFAAEVLELQGLKRLKVWLEFGGIRVVENVKLFQITVVWFDIVKGYIEYIEGLLENYRPAGKFVYSSHNRSLYFCRTQYCVNQSLFLPA